MYRRGWVGGSGEYGSRRVFCFPVVKVLFDYWYEGGRDRYFAAPLP